MANQDCIKKSYVLLSELRAVAAKTLESRRNRRLMQKFGAKSVDSIQLVESLLDDLITKSVLAVEASSQPQEPESASQSRSESPAERSVGNSYLDPVDAAVRFVILLTIVIFIYFPNCELTSMFTS